MKALGDVLYDGLVRTKRRSTTSLSRQAVTGDVKSFTLRYIDWEHPPRGRRNGSENALYVAVDTGYLDEVSFRELFDTVEETSRMLRDFVEAFRKRLQEVAGFQYVPQPMPMRNEKGAVIYYLFFASPNRTGNHIVEDIFNKYRERGFR